MSFIIKCDSCGVESTSSTATAYPEGWVSLRLQATGLRAYTYNTRNKTLCADCLEKAGITTKPDLADQDASLDKLWNVMLDLTGEARDNI